MQPTCDQGCDHAGKKARQSGPEVAPVELISVAFPGAALVRDRAQRVSSASPVAVAPVPSGTSRGCRAAPEFAVTGENDRPRSCGLPERVARSLPHRSIRAAAWRRGAVVKVGGAPLE